MLTAEGCAARRARFWSAMGEGYDLALIGEPHHLTYLCGFWQNPFSFRSQRAAAVLILEPGGGALLTADNLQGADAAQAHVDHVLAPIWYRGDSPADSRIEVLIREVVREVLQRKPDRIAVDAGLPAGVLLALESELPRAAVVDVGATITSLRRCKHADEAEQIAAACAAAAAASDAAREQARPGMTELQVHALVSRLAMEHAGEPVQVYGDFASGPRTWQGGGPPTRRVIEEGDPFLLDFSVILRGYRGDFANTFLVGDAQPDSRVRELAERCLEALATAERMLVPGTACREVDMAAKGILNGYEPGSAYKHHTGHGIGLGHPEAPFLVPHSEEVLTAGDVITLEPGQYVPDLVGMRFERNYLIEPEGCRHLSHHRLGL